MKTIGADEDRPDMSPVSKLNESPGFEVKVWSAMSSFFKTTVLLTPITNVTLAGEKLARLLPDPAGAIM